MAQTNPYDAAAKKVAPPIGASPESSYFKILESLQRLGTPFPEAPNWDQGDTTPPPPGTPGWEQILKFGANTGAAGFAGLGKIGAFPVAMGMDAVDWLMHGDPAPTAPQAAQTPQMGPKNPPGPGTAMPGLMFDQTYQIPGSGSPMPAYPTMQVPGYSPDYAAADARFKAAAPQRPSRDPGEQLVLGGAEGLAQASTQRARGGWGGQLAQMVGGFAQGMAQSRRQMDEDALRYEEQMEKHNLLLAGVEASRAEAQARAKVDRARVENETATQQWRAQVAQWEAGQPQVQLLGDGSVVAISRDPTGKTTVQRMGQEDQFKIANAIAAAKASGVGGKAATNARILSQFGPAGAQLAAISELGTIPGVLESLIPEDQQENFQNEFQEKLMQAQGLSGTAQQGMVENVRMQLLIKYVMGDPFARQRLNQYYGQ